MNKNITISTSSIHGNGIFAKKDFKKGETVFIIKGKLIHWIVNNQKESLYGPDWIGIRKTVWINPDGAAKYLNHSCSANCGIRGKVKVTAIKDIKKNEEITVDYSITEIDRMWHMKCQCGSKNCRKTVRSIQFLPKKIYNKYNPYIPTYFKNIYESKG